MPSAPITPFTSAQINSILQISKTAASNAGFVSGETLQAIVVEKVDENKYLLSLKNVLVPASSDLPLKPGDKLVVKVTSLQPQITLSMMDPAETVPERTKNAKLPEPLTPVIPVKTNSTLQISKTAVSNLGLTPGETFQTTVVEKIAENKYLLSLKNVLIPAISDGALKLGDKLVVKVTNLQPQITLSVMDPAKVLSDQKVNEKLAASLTPVVAAKTNSTLQIAKTAAPNIGISPGETLQTTVVEKVAENKYLLSLKNVLVPATSDVSLKPGDKIFVKVTSLQPQITLSMMDPAKAVMDQKVNEKLLFFRSNPNAILKMLTQSEDLTEMFEKSGLTNKFPSGQIDKLLKLLENIVLSGRTSSNKLFIRDFISNSGLLLEHSLGALVSQGDKSASVPLEDNIKTIMMKLSAAVDAELAENPESDPVIKASLKTLSNFTSDGVKTIEARQAVNVVFQESDYGLALQIPVASGDTTRLIDLFIRPEGKNEKGEYTFSSCSIVIFLDLDVLGKISINVGIREGSFRSLIKCEREEIKELLNKEVGRLKAALVEIGYRVDSLECLRESDLLQSRNTFMTSQSFSERELVNYFA